MAKTPGSPVLGVRIGALKDRYPNGGIKPNMEEVATLMSSFGTEAGATFQWTAVGEGNMDFRQYTDYLRTLCPGVPIHLETISNSPREIPFLDIGY